MFLEVKDVNVNKIIDEFLAANIDVIKVELIDKNISRFEFAEGQDLELINNIIAEHDPTEIKQLTNEERMTQIENAILELAALLGGE